MKFLTIFTKTKNIDQSAVFLSQRACWVEGQNRPDSQKITHLFLHAQACLKYPIFQQIKTQCHSEGIPISYRRLSATKNTILAPSTCACYSHNFFILHAILTEYTKGNLAYPK